LPRKKTKKILPEANSFSEQIKTIVKDLYYISETDSEVFPFVGETATNVSADELLRQLGRIDSVEERVFEDFYKRLTEIQEWFGDEETATANKFSELKELLMKNLKDLKVFKVGKIQVDIYIVGLNSESILAGVWTKAVET
jgi:hypothetical protein